MTARVIFQQHAFRDPRRIVTADRPGQVAAALRALAWLLEWLWLPPCDFGLQWAMGAAGTW